MKWHAGYPFDAGKPIFPELFAAISLFIKDKSKLDQRVEANSRTPCPG